jgi:hypothetical protein
MLVKIEKERERDTWKGSWDDDMTEYHFYIFLRFIGKPTRLIKTKYDNRSMEEMWKENEWVSEWERERETKSLDNRKMMLKKESAINR